MHLSVDEKWFAFWTMRRRGTANIAIANLLGISRQAVSKALHSIDGKIESALRDMARANRIQVEKIDMERGILFGRSVPFQTSAYIFVSEKHGMQVWYEHDGDCKACDEFTGASNSSGISRPNSGSGLKRPRTRQKWLKNYSQRSGRLHHDRVSEIAGHWFGLCRKPPVFRASHEEIIILPESVHEGLPDGGGGGLGVIRRGIGAAIAGLRTLNRNRQLLWFTLIAGLGACGKHHRPGCHLLHRLDHG